MFKLFLIFDMGLNRRGINFSEVSSHNNRI